MSTYENYFYSCFDLNHKKYCKQMHGVNLRYHNHDHNYDIAPFRKLVEQCFSDHVLTNSKLIDIEDIELFTFKGNQLFRDDDMSNLFINKYYKYPDIQKLYRNDQSVLEDINAERVFENILDSITAPDVKVVIQGDVGDGKSTFLSKLALDLYNYKDDEIQILPIVINIHKYNALLESQKSDALEMFWQQLYKDIIKDIKDKKDIIVYETQRVEKKTKSLEKTTLLAKLSLMTKLSAIIASMEASLNASDENSIVEEENTTLISTTDYTLIEKLKKIITELDTQQIRTVLIFDNLDTLYYDHERYMLFEKGFKKLNTKIKLVKDIVHNVTDELKNAGCSYIFTVRPYVYNHVFNNLTQDSQSNQRVTELYRLKHIEPNMPVDMRLDMLRDLVEYLKDSKQLKPGKKKRLENHLHDFLRIIDECKRSNRNLFEKFFSLSNQGFRSIIRFYRDTLYNPTIFNNYFTHDILFLYKLSRRELYSQLFGPSCNLKKSSYYPNMFLVSCDNYCNIEYEEACKPHGLTYWLKYLILFVVFNKEGITVREILNIFSAYEEHVVRLAIGSLATANEYNCISLYFSSDPEMVTKLEAIASLYMTSRGSFLINKDYSFNFENIQLYFDDWLLPKPKIEKLGIEDESIKSIYQVSASEDRYSYQYLLNGNRKDHRKDHQNIISIKAKQSLLFLYFLESTKALERQKYYNTWKKIERYSKKHSRIFDDDFFTVMRKDVIDQANIVYGKDKAFKEGLIKFNKKLSGIKQNIDEFYKTVYHDEDVKITCEGYGI